MHPTLLYQLAKARIDEYRLAVPSQTPAHRLFRGAGSVQSAVHPSKRR
jgi:hypothetical protein